MLKISYVVMAFIVVYIMPAQAGQFTPRSAVIQLPATLNIPGSLAVGSVIWSSGKVVTQLSGIVSEKYVNVSVSAGMAPGFDDVYRTNVAGIGVRYNLWFASPDYPAGKKISPSYYGEPLKNWAASDSYQQKISIELVKIGPIKSTASVTKIPELWLALCIVAGQPCWMDFKLNTSGASSIKIGPSCKVSTPVIAVGLGKVSLSAFTRIGDAASPSYFYISLSCIGGDVGVSTYPYVTLTDVVRPGNTTDALSLTPGSTASGISIQIFHGDDLLKFGPDSSAINNVNQWAAGEIKRGEALFKIPLRARYVRTGSQLQPGTANGQVTFTFSWR